MESLRHQLLQAELTRIEQEAEARSCAIMNKADTLVAATLLCAKINEGLMDGPCFKPTVGYSYDTTCEIDIFTNADGDVFLRRCIELGFSWHELRATFEGSHIIEISGLCGVQVFMQDKFLAAHALKAAA